MTHRARPTYGLIRNAREEVNPEEFFTEGDAGDDGRFHPERGDIVTIHGRTVLVLSAGRRNRETGSVTAFDMRDGGADYNTLSTIRYVRSVPELVGRADSPVVERALEEARMIMG